jgi:hypothetical protein
MISDGFGVTLASSVELFEPWDPLGTIPSVDLGDFLTARTALTVRRSPRQKLKMADPYFPTLRLIFVPSALITIYGHITLDSTPWRNEYALYRVKIPDALLSHVIPAPPAPVPGGGGSKLAGGWLFHASDSPNTTLHLELDPSTGGGKVSVPPSTEVVLRLENGTFVYGSSWMGNWAEGSQQHGAHGSLMVTTSTPPRPPRKLISPAGTTLN